MEWTRCIDSPWGVHPMGDTTEAARSAWAFPARVVGLLVGGTIDLDR